MLQHQWAMKWSASTFRRSCLTAAPDGLLRHPGHQPRCRRRRRAESVRTPTSLVGFWEPRERGTDPFNCSRSSQQPGADRRACCCCRYRNLALKWHPLRCDEADAQSNFDEVSEAFEVLSDCESRLPPADGALSQHAAARR